MNELMRRRRALMEAGQKARLPAEYQEVEWIKANGSAYIRTEIRPYKTTLYCDFAFQNPGNGQRMVYSHASNNQYYAIAPLIDGGKRNWSAVTKYNKFLDTGVPFDKNRHSLVFNDADGNVWLDGSIVVTSPSFDLGAVGNVTLLFSNNAYPANNTFFGDVVFVDKDTGNEIGRLVPCYRRADSEIGMYDLVNGAFYTNYNTTGYFTKGADV